MAANKLPGKYSIIAKIVIEAPASDVWDVLADFSAVDTWAPSVTHSYSLSHKDQGVGAERHCDIKGFGGIDEVVTAWDEGKSLSYRVTPIGALGVSHNRWTVIERNESRSEVIVELAYDVRFGMLGALLHAIMMRPKLTSAFPKGLEALKSRVETGRLVRPRRSEPGKPQLAAA